MFYVLLYSEGEYFIKRDNFKFVSSRQTFFKSVSMGLMLESDWNILWFTWDSQMNGNPNVGWKLSLQYHSSPAYQSLSTHAPYPWQLTRVPTSTHVTAPAHQELLTQYRRSRIASIGSPIGQILINNYSYMTRCMTLFLFLFSIMDLSFAFFFRVCLFGAPFVRLQAMTI